ncbi:MAG TPA: hypothetical protein VIH59_05820, partial [Candidatus Tectomicrobia bacterium]
SWTHHEVLDLLKVGTLRMSNALEQGHATRARLDTSVRSKRGSLSHGIAGLTRLVPDSTPVERAR